MDKGFEITYCIAANNVHDNYSFCECLNFVLFPQYVFLLELIELLLWQLFNEGNYSMEEIIFKNMFQRFISHWSKNKGGSSRDYCDEKHNFIQHSKFYGKQSFPYKMTST